MDNSSPFGESTIEELALRQAISEQLDRIQVVVDYMVQGALGSVYKSAEDASILMAAEDDLLNPEAKALSELLRTNERDAQVHSLYGVESYTQLSASKRLFYNIFEAPLTVTKAEQEVIDERIKVEDQIIGLLTKNMDNLTEVELSCGEFGYVDKSTGFRYWVSSLYGLEVTAEPDLDVAINSSETQEQVIYTRRQVLEHIHAVLDSVEDLTLTFIT